MSCENGREPTAPGGLPRGASPVGMAPAISAEQLPKRPATAVAGGFNGVAKAQNVRDNLDMSFSPLTIRCGVLIAAVAWAGTCMPAPADDEAGLAFDQAKPLIAQRDHNAALAKLDKAVRLAPKCSQYLGMRGVVWLRKGDYAKGAADLKAAIAANAGDDGISYKPLRETPLSAQAIEHGRKQLAAMLQDRPPMAQFGDEAKIFRNWAERKFAGEDFGQPIDWDRSPPLHSDAEHLAPGEGQNAAILVQADYTHGPSAGKPRSFEELWAGAVYELYNVSNAREFTRLNDEADRGKVSKEQFVAGILKYELLAAQHTRAFYVQVFLPWAEKKKLPTDPALWFCDWWDTPEKAMQHFSDKSAYPWRPYARVYDWATVHRCWRHAEFAKAQTLLEEMRTEDNYDDELYDVLYWLGRCLLRLDKPKEALSALNESIEQNPHNAAAYRTRAEVHDKLGDKSNAEADREAAKKAEKAEKAEGEE
jgi:tetratricopeptide (TPR) repeat protein